MKSTGQLTIVAAGRDSTPLPDAMLLGAGFHRGYVDGTSLTAQFRVPDRVALDAAGNIYVADIGNRNVRQITTRGNVTTFAGIPGGAGNRDGEGPNATFFDPGALAVDRAGNVYVADVGNHTIRKITPTGSVTTLAGVPGKAGLRDGDAQTALFNGPTALAIGRDGVLYANDGVLRKISATGQVTTVDGISIEPNGPGYYLGGFAFDEAGNILVTDSDNHVVRKIAPDKRATIFAGVRGQSGFQDGPATQARFNRPTGLAVGRDGAVYVLDTFNAALRKIAANGTVTTLLAEKPEIPGTGSIGTPPGGVVVDAENNVFVTVDRTLRRIAFSGEIRTVVGTPIPLGEPGNVSGGSAGFLRGLTLHSDGTLYVVDSWNGAILRGEPQRPARLANLSIRALAGNGSAVLIAGFTASGAGGKRVLLRGIGPGLQQFGVSGALVDPQLSLFDPAGTKRNENDNWSGTDALAAAFASVGAFGLARDSRDAVLLVELPNGNHTAHVTGSPAGQALLEIYDVNPDGDARLTNISARASVGPATAFLAGFTVSGGVRKTVLIRAVGPSLAGFGVTGVAAAVKLTLYDRGGNTITTNEGWGGVAKLSEAFARVGAFPLSPRALDSALMIDLDPGTYSVQLSGLLGVSGTALIEIYDADP